jgi:type IV secretory pathway TraG/TraD family ATPase VirD4
MYFNFKHRLKNYGEKSSILVEEELASIFHIPTSRYNYTPIIEWLSYKVLAPPTNLPAEGILMGNNVYRGKKQPVFIMPNDRTRHMYVVGKSGSGKSVLLNYMARQDVVKGNGCCVIDPHGDLIEDCLGYIPKERARDVIHFSPADQARPMGLNMLQAKSPEQMDMASSQATEIFIKLFGDEIFGPRIQHYFRNACLTLMEDQEEGATLIDVPRMFVDEEFMNYKVSKTKNPVVKSFWEHEYANTGDREKQEMIPYFSSKFGPFITNTIMRNTIGQPKSAFDFRSAMDEGKVLLVNLSKGKIGDLNTQLLGLVCVAKLQQSAMSRVDMPEDKRRPFYMYVDEFQNFATESFCSILSEARKYKLALIMAHQYIGQLTVTKGGSTTTQIRDAVFGNVGTILSFKVGADDGEYLEKEYAPVLSANDVVGISNYKAYCKLLINNAPSRPFSIETIYDTSGYKQKTAEIVKEYCRLKYGRKRAFVDQEIEARIGIT